MFLKTPQLQDRCSETSLRSGLISPCNRDVFTVLNASELRGKKTQTQMQVRRKGGSFFPAVCQSDQDSSSGAEGIVLLEVTFRSFVTAQK